MPKHTAAFAIALLLLAGLWIFLGRKTPQKKEVYVPQAKNEISRKVQFLGSRYASYAYKIAPGELSDDARKAITGFLLETKQLPDGSVQVTLNAGKKEYHTQVYTVKPGYTLYFLEESKNDDDVSSNTDLSLEDDTAVLVDPEGYIITE